MSRGTNLYREPYGMRTSGSSVVNVLDLYCPTVLKCRVNYGILRPFGFDMDSELRSRRTQVDMGV
jgi:hypothetical protein